MDSIRGNLGYHTCNKKRDTSTVSRLVCLPVSTRGMEAPLARAGVPL